ncbi:MAG: hypothetical protein AB7Q00_06835 [Phycisphaerales bacterium]
MNERARIIEETSKARDRASALLKGLMDAKASSERHLSETGQRDVYKTVTGKSSLDNAIQSAQRVVETLTKALAEYRRNLQDGDLALIRGDSIADVTTVRAQ